MPGARLPLAKGTRHDAPKTQRFVDVFAGCGGLSLGLMEAGWKGVFAIEKDPHAFATLKANLVHGEGPKFDWPRWLPKGTHDIKDFMRTYGKRLARLRGQIDLLVGGPPCQGFSSAGRRNPVDPRNTLFKRYLKMVGLLQPRMVLLENVRGISAEFPRTHGRRGSEPFVDRIRRALERRGYKTFPILLRSVDLGVPQVRPRFFMVGVHRGSYAGRGRIPSPFSQVDELKADFLERLGLQGGKRVTVADAISDLQLKGKSLIECADSPGFKQIRYAGPRTEYQRQMHGTMNGHAPNSLRLVNHRPKIRARYVRMVKSARKGVQLSPSERRKFGVRKMAVAVLDKHAPSHTLTTLPDDFVHYSEPRILTVRECARLQSFPDWFEFKGVYTTGGLRRRQTCPRYTQVGNAVPPRVATFLGELVMNYSARLYRRST